MVNAREKDLRFLVTMAVIAGVIFLVFRDEVVGASLEPLARLTAQTTLALLHWLGIEALRDGTIIHQAGGFAYNIAYSCTAILPVTFLAASILAYPATPQHKLLGLCVGVTVLPILNLIRLVHLFHVGVHAPAEFQFWHELLWEGVIQLSVLAMWYGWSLWSERHAAARTFCSLKPPIIFQDGSPQLGGAVRVSSPAGGKSPLITR